MIELKKIFKKLFIILSAFIIIFTLNSCNSNVVEYEIHTEAQITYLEGDYKLISLYAKGDQELSKPKPITISWDASKDVKEFSFYLSKDNKFNDYRLFKTNIAQIELINLEIHTNYYWYVEYIQDIQRQTEAYQSLPVSDWSYYTWQGFYMALEKELQNGDWGYVPNKQGGFWGFYWHWKKASSNPDVDIYLQLEEKKLCVKAYQKGGVEKGYIYSSQLVELAKEKNISLVKPDRLRKGTTMTLAVHKFPDTANFSDIVRLLREIENFLDEASRYL